MSTYSPNSVDSALSFMPEAATKPRRLPGPLAYLRDLLEAISSGLAAMHRYEALRAGGMSPSDAAAKVHAEFYSN